MTELSELSGAAQPESDRLVDWPWARGRALAAVDGLIERKLERALKGENLVTVTAKPLELPPGKLLYSYAKSSVRKPAGGWEQLPFYLVDADREGGSRPTLSPVDLKYEPEGLRLVFEITPQVREALGSATHVHVAYADDFELGLLRRLRPALAETSRAPRLLDLWSSSALPGPVEAKDLNAEQREALAAMTSEGGSLVWGPPGTGKTKVIVRAVEHALQNGRSVLIASHTHVAVDNVVEDIAKAVDKAGVVVRVGGREKVSQKVAEHPWLTLDKAAATIVNRDERLKEIDDAVKALDEAPERARLASIADRLAGTDLGAVESAIEAGKANAEADRLDEESIRLGEIIDDLTSEARGVESQIAESKPAVESLHQLRAAANRAAHDEAAAAQTLRSLEQSLAALHAACARAHTDWSAAAEARERGMPWTRFFARSRAESAANRAAQLQAQITTAEEHAKHARRGVNHAHAVHVDAAARLKDAEAKASLVRQLERRLAELQAQLVENTAALTNVRGEALRAHEAAAAVPDFAAVLAAAEKDDVLALRDERERLNEAVAALDKRKEKLEQDRVRLEDEFKDTKRQLLEGAPVIASTLASLVSKPELAKRRFDIVIIDEAASAQIPWLVNAGSKADHVLSYVGDFLQNEPIADIGDATNDEQRNLLRWQQNDIFALLGIRDRATAEDHPRCAALRTQYRYPPVIAGIVNDFCYAGLLQTDWRGEREETHVVFVDTTKHPDAGLRRSGKSWTHPLGLDLLRAIRVHETKRGVEEIGLVCPYRAHADEATRLANNEQLQIACGTSHKFQGCQFSTVVFDLMQDDQERWAGVADLAGSQRQVSAAKLLNVGITRAQNTLYLIGDWAFVKRSKNPGMQAIANLEDANLEDKPGFVRLTAAQILDSAGLDSLQV